MSQSDQHNKMPSGGARTIVRLRFPMNQDEIKLLQKIVGQCTQTKWDELCPIKNKCLAGVFLAGPLDLEQSERKV